MGFIYKGPQLLVQTKRFYGVAVAQGIAGRKWPGGRDTELFRKGSLLRGGEAVSPNWGHMAPNPRDVADCLRGL